MNVERKYTRRVFLQTAITTALLAGCTKPGGVTPAQEAGRIQGDSTVALVRCSAYDEAMILSCLKDTTKGLTLPDFRNKRVVLKPNMVEPGNGRPVTTDKAVVAAAIEYADHLGANEIIVAEGPGHFRDTDYLLEVTGIGEVLRKKGVRFVDLNLDDIGKVKNVDGFAAVDAYYLPKTIIDADAVVSVPKLKMHHWVGLTASMKNLFGVIPGRHYGWPKNKLHWLKIPYVIIDLVRLLRPQLAIVDGIVGMEGDGPIFGSPKKADVIVVGTDPAAVDATCARVMKLSDELFARIEYLALAERVIGNTRSENIRIAGCPLSEIAQYFEPAPAFLNPATVQVGKLAS